jgi:ElaB/YqjD/DUF883 family membrane-anchored ribosome-binding protein
MAEERYLATARAPEATDDTDAAKAELQRRMEEARESITQTVSEIKDTVTTQYQNVRESISQTLDWREQYRRRPVAFAVGATAVGVIAGYTIGGVIFGDGESDLVDRYYEADGDGYESSAAGGAATQLSAGSSSSSTTARLSAYAPPAAYPAAQPTPPAPTQRPSYSSGYEAQTAQAEDEPDKPGLLERFKETQAYDRLQHELGNIGNRVVDELSKTAQTVVLPMLLNKLKDLIGLDLSAQRTTTQGPRGQQASGGQQTGQQTGQPGSTPNAPATTGGYGSA